MTSRSSPSGTNAVRKIGTATASLRGEGRVRAPCERPQHPDDGDRQEPGDDRNGQDEYEQRDPLPQRNVHQLELEEDPGEEALERPVAELLPEGRHLSDRDSGDLPDPDSILARYPLKQDVDLPFPGLDRPDSIPVRRQPIIGLALGVLAQAFDVDPELARQRDAELTGQRGAIGFDPAQVQKPGGLVVVLLFGRGQVALHRTAGGSTSQLVVHDQPDLGRGLLNGSSLLGSRRPRQHEMKHDRDAGRRVAIPMTPRYRRAPLYLRIFPRHSTLPPWFLE
jgi:hypothetical protein